MKGLKKLAQNHLVNNEKKKKVKNIQHTSEHKELMTQLSHK